ncbi:unnamed protein product [Meganyctiphanes norvegica]|uniref:Uncharacterized protein n=1 Tax=Meganyctiphanes norvegica TaxID=48144 RepID=A0AAV2SHK8_MEGNR
MCRPYAFMKVMEGCIGREAVQAQKMKMMTSVRDTCLSMPTVWDDSMDEPYPEPEPQGEPEPFPEPEGDGMNMTVYEMGDGMNMTMDDMMGDMMPGMMGMPGMPPGMMGNMMGEMMGGMMGDMKNMMEGMMGDMMSMKGMIEPSILSNITCIMQQMEWMDEKQNPNPRYLKDMITSLNLNPFITMSMQKEIAMCHAKSMCHMDMESPFGPKLSKMMAYAKCIGYGMFKSCAMNEVMMKMPMGPMNETTMPAFMAAMGGGGFDPEEAEKDSAFMGIIMTMFGPMSPFMQ